MHTGVGCDNLENVTADSMVHSFVTCVWTNSTQCMMAWHGDGCCRTACSCKELAC
jgi:hypothetical protein